MAITKVMKKVFMLSLLSLHRLISDHPRGTLRRRVWQKDRRDCGIESLLNMSTVYGYVKTGPGEEPMIFDPEFERPPDQPRSIARTSFYKKLTANCPDVKFGYR